jgi:hypothetical protein
MNTIWKLVFPLADGLIIQLMPDGATFLHSGMQMPNSDCEPEMATWWRVNTANPLKNRRFRIFGTGHEIPDTEMAEYITSFITRNGEYVWHLFSEKEKS